MRSQHTYQRRKEGAAGLWLKGCPRCGTGDMAADHDIYGVYRYCVQCGYYQDMISEGDSDKNTVKEEIAKESVLAGTP
ncbi:MAG: hypothetical protein HYX93_01430 [Chloroflexi bacterium]|nr:hypothetical protein [Chloroflexota bacterium]